MSTNTIAIYRSSIPTVKNSDSGLQKFIQKAHEAPILTQEEEFKLFIRLREDNDIEAAHKLVHSYLRYVLKIAKEYQNYKLNLSDLVQEGTVGLMQAVQKFDPNRGNRLATYAVWWIRAAIHDYILRSWRMVKIATTQLKRQLFFKLRQAKDSSFPLNIDEAEELAKKFGTDPQTILEVDGRMSWTDTSLNQPIMEDEGEMLYLIPDMRPNQEHKIAEHEHHEVMVKLISKGMNKLNAREREVISKRFLADKQVTLESLGEQFSLSRERIRQIEKNALDKLRLFFKNSNEGCSLIFSDN
ncbi:MAG: RNA polymerase factor sigma-32 [Magnetococcales bacterium]|nr:RNA polymerase factor sigma-32 [Magnetococcales bacterium]